MTQPQQIRAARALLRAVFESFPQLLLWPEPTARLLFTLWTLDREHGYSDREFFERYGEPAGIISIAGCTMRVIENTLAGPSLCPNCGERVQ